MKHWKCCQIDPGTLGHPGTSWDILGHPGTSWDILGHPGTSWDVLGIHPRRINERGARSGASGAASRPGESTRKVPVVSPADRGRMAPESGFENI